MDFSIDLQRMFCESLPKVPRKQLAQERVSMETNSPQSTFAAVSLRNVAKNEILLVLAGIKEFLQYGLAFTLGIPWIFFGFLSI